MTSLVESLSGQIETLYGEDGEPYWKIRDYGLTVFGSENNYLAVVSASDNLHVGVGTNNIVAKASAELICSLISKIDTEVTRAKQWITTDAAEGIFGDWESLTDFNQLWHRKVDPRLYLNGSGHLARNYDPKKAGSLEEARAMDAIYARFNSDGIIGSGLDRNRDDSPNRDATNGFYFVCAAALDTWIRDGGLDQALKTRGPTI